MKPYEDPDFAWRSATGLIQKYLDVDDSAIRRALQRVRGLLRLDGELDETRLATMRDRELDDVLEEAARLRDMDGRLLAVRATMARKQQRLEVLRQLPEESFEESAATTGSIAIVPRPGSSDDDVN